MKKLILSVAIAVAALATTFYSCSKEEMNSGSNSDAANSSNMKQGNREDKLKDNLALLQKAFTGLTSNQVICNTIAEEAKKRGART